MLANGQFRLSFDAAHAAAVAALDRMIQAGFPAVDLSLHVSADRIRHQALLPNAATAFDASRLAIEIASHPGVDAVTLSAAQRRGYVRSVDSLIEWREIDREFGSVETARAA